MGLAGRESAAFPAHSLSSIPSLTTIFKERTNSSAHRDLTASNSLEPPPAVSAHRVWNVVDGGQGTI